MYDFFNMVEQNILLHALLDLCYLSTVVIMTLGKRLSSTYTKSSTEGTPSPR